MLGLIPYFKDARSYEIIWFFAQSLYFYLKVTNTNTVLPLADYIKASPVKQKVPTLMLFSFLNCFLIILIILKFMYFITLYHTFGTMIQLVFQTIKQIYQFFAFYFLMLFIFSCVMMCLGYDSGGAAPEPDEPERVFSQTSIFQYFISIFNNSVGNIVDPSYKLWKDLDTEEGIARDGNANFHRSIMIILI